MSARPAEGSSYDPKRIEQLILQRVARARKEEILAVYQDLLQTIWNRILPTLGRMTVMVIMERALLIAQETHPVLRHVRVTQEGLSFENLQEQVNEIDQETLRNAFKELVANVIDILALLTGDILVRRLIKELEEKQS